MGRWAAFLYGALAYLILLPTSLYLIGFVGNLYVPKSIDSGAPVAPAEALAVDLSLVALFGLQHSIMARPRFKRAWTRLVPEPIERSTYVLATSLCLVFLFWQWRPMTRVVWSVSGPGALALSVAFWLGWLIQLASTFMVSHFDLFGLRQVSASPTCTGGPPRPWPS